MEKHVDIENARSLDQKEALERIIQRNECPFCIENLEKEHEKPILREGVFWIVTENQWPYKGTRLHFLLILKRHEEYVEGLSQEEFAELHTLLLWANKKFGIEGGVLGIRFGKSDFSGSTVTHIHAHIIAPEYRSKVALWMGKEIENNQNEK